MENWKDIDVSEWHSDEFMNFLNQHYGRACLWCGEGAGNRGILIPFDDGGATTSTMVSFAEIMEEHTDLGVKFLTSRVMGSGWPTLSLICKKCGYVYSFKLSEIYKRYKANNGKL
ncbi:MAG: hypothetical protein LBV04_08715 [Deferribacteraceae bacterium]|jgi:hypothetical protein|nr:hypothetical protein [Deferribacteraceae bacterium]